MEAYNYPIYATMWHPEYQILDYVGDKGWDVPDNKFTDEIAYRLSHLLNRHAKMNSNRPTKGCIEQICEGMKIVRNKYEKYPLMDGFFVEAVGYESHPKL